jgi:hypothetical protein
VFVVNPPWDSAKGRIVAVSCTEGGPYRLAVRLIDEDRVVFCLSHPSSEVVISPGGTWAAVYREGKPMRRIVLPSP